MKDNVNKLKFTTNGTNRHEQQGNMITRVRGVCLVRGLFSLLCVTAVLFTACEFNFDSRPDSGGGGFVAVTEIVGIPTGSEPYIGISLSGTVMPENATNKKTVWSIANDGGTNSTLVGSRLTADADGTVTVTAVIKDGLAEGRDFTQSFNIRISSSLGFEVKLIRGVPVYLPIGTYTFKNTENGGTIRVVPSNAVNTTIIWSVIDAGGTGATIYGNVLTTRLHGTVRILATIENGLLEGRDYTQEFTIVVAKNAHLSGYYRTTSNGINQACYWIGEELITLPVPEEADNSRATGIVFAGGTQYIAGYYTIGGTNYACYWAGLLGDDPILLDQGSGAAGSVNDPTTRTYSIAADGRDIYITGRVGTNTAYCYWKITGGTGTGSKIPCVIPGGETMSPNNTYANNAYTGRLAVNNGDVYITFQTGTYKNYKNYYWDKNGDYQSITIPASPTVQYYPNVTCAAIAGGRVYFAGYYYNGPSVSYPTPFFWIKDTASYTHLTDVTSGGQVTSVVVQNGAPVFYGYFNNNEGYTHETELTFWDTTGEEIIRSQMTILDLYDLYNVFFSDGDVYVLLSSNTENSRYVNTGYGVIGKTLSDLIDGQSRWGDITGIAVSGITEVPLVPVTGVTLNKTSLALKTGKTEILVAEVKPADASNHAVTWASSNHSVATVTHGTVTAVAPGTAVITVTTAEGGKTATCNVTVTPYVFMEMVNIPAGTFTMGSPVSETGRGTDETQWSVTLSAFKMGMYEVTQGQWLELMGEESPVWGQISDYYGKGDNYPVNFTSYIETIAFCNKLSLKEGLTPAYNFSGVTNPDNWAANNAWRYWTVTYINTNMTFVHGNNGYRLPTEAQWEYACRAGTTTAFNIPPNGSSALTFSQANFDDPNSTEARKLKEVGSYAPNKWGLYDMHGNVAEWCWDVYANNYVTTTTTDPIGAAVVNNSWRVYRGGSFESGSVSLRSAARANNVNAFQGTGFRVALPAGD